MDSRLRGNDPNVPLMYGSKRLTPAPACISQPKSALPTQSGTLSSSSRRRPSRKRSGKARADFEGWGVAVYMSPSKSGSNAIQNAFSSMSPAAVPNAFWQGASRFWRVKC